MHYSTPAQPQCGAPAFVYLCAVVLPRCGDPSLPGSCAPWLLMPCFIATALPRSDALALKRIRVLSSRAPTLNHSCDLVLPALSSRLLRSRSPEFHAFALLSIRAFNLWHLCASTSTRPHTASLSRIHAFSPLCLRASGTQCFCLSTPPRCRASSPVCLPTFALLHFRASPPSRFHTSVPPHLHASAPPHLRATASSRLCDSALHVFNPFR